MSQVLKNFEPLLLAMDSFIRANGNFESSIVINTAVEELEKCESLQQCFAIPLQHKLFNIDSALKWVLFINIVPEKIIEQNSEDEEFTPLLEDFNTFTSDFSANDSLKLIASVYDLGVQDIVLSHLEDDSDDESDGDSDDDSSNSDDDSDKSSEEISESIVSKKGSKEKEEN